MPLYYHSWMFYNHFLEALYHFFGTNLLTQCPVPVAVFCLFFTSQEINIKWSPNTAKLFVVFYGSEDHRWAKEAPGGCPEGGTTHQGAPRWVVPTPVASRTPSLHYKFPNILQPFGVNLDQKFRRRKSL